MASKLLGINISTFSRLIEGNYIYVDKTKIIYDIVTSGEPNFFLSRPRRFGKSLLVSTLESLFLGHKHLFKNCWIGQSDYDFKSYHVLSFDFSTFGLSNAQEFKTGLSALLADITKRYDIPLEEKNNPVVLLRRLIQHLAITKPVVILIDEYDYPILRHIHTLDTAFEMQSILRDFFTTIKGLNQYLRFVFLTGVSKFTQTSVFSGLNNLQDLTLSPRGAALLGYTEEEIHHYFGDRLALIAPDQKALFDKIRYWYNGYRFSRTEITVFAPYSILLFLREDGHFSNYWFDTATPSFLINLLRTKNYNLNDLNKPILQERELGSFELEHLPFTTLLYQTGYLTIKRYNPETGECLLDYPNFEVRESFAQYIAKLCTRLTESRIKTYATEMLTHLKKRSINDFLITLQDFFRRIPYTIAIKDEKTVQLIIYALCQLMGVDVKVEVATLFGRIDLTLTTQHDIFIIELKYDTPAQEAIDQINRKEYYSAYENSDKIITLVGVSFDSEKRTLADEWIIKKLL